MQITKNNYNKYNQKTSIKSNTTLLTSKTLSKQFKQNQQIINTKHQALNNNSKSANESHANQTNNNQKQPTKVNQIAQTKQPIEQTKPQQ